MSQATPHMRPSRVLAKLRAGKSVFSAKLNLSDAACTELAGMCGYDCTWLCNEHVPSAPTDILTHIRTAKAFDMDTLVRVQRGSYSDLIHPLEMDATGIMVPHVMSADDAREVAWRTRFHPIGRRPLDGGFSDGAFCQIPVEDYLREANEQRFVIVQIEDPEALDELDEIAAVEGIDMLLFGMGDLSHGMGIPGQYTHPKILDARKRVAEAALKHGKFAAIPAAVGDIDELMDEGFRFFNVAADVIGLGNYFRDVAAAIADKR